MVKQTGHKTADDAKAMGQMQLPGVDLAAENAALRERNAQLMAEVAALKARLGETIQSNQLNADPVPAKIDTLRRFAQLARLGVDGVDIIREHVESWSAGDGVNVGRERLQAALNAIYDMQFSVHEKKWIASWVNRTLGRVGLILSRPGLDIAGSLSVIVGTGGSGSFRLQWSEHLSKKRIRRNHTLGPRLGQIVVKENPKGPRHHELRVRRESH